MNRYAVRLLLGGILAVGLCASAAHAVQMALAPGDKAPETISVYDLEAQKTTESYGKRATFVLWWTTWSEPSKELLAALQTVNASRAGEGLRIIALVANYTTVSDIKATVEQAEVTFTVGKPRSSTRKSWRGVVSYPTSFLIDRDRVIVRRYSGATAEQIEGMLYDINALMNDKPLGPYIMPERSNARTLTEHRRELKGEF